MNILILDTETTGLDPDKGAKVIEIGALLYSIRYKQVLQSFATLLRCEDNPVEHINHIKPEWTQAGFGFTRAIDFLIDMATHSTYIIAHNAQFDKRFMETVIASTRFWIPHWICTKNDFEWPVKLHGRSLKDICEAMGVPYVDAHRALNDCQFLADCFSKVEDLEERIMGAADKNIEKIETMEKKLTNMV